MTLYPNNSTKQVVDNELNKKLKKFDERIENNSSEITSLKSRVSNTEDNITSINGDIEGLEEDIGSLDTRVDTVELALDEKQDTLNFDNVPTDNSDNPVKSGGIYNALETKLDKESVKFDPEPNGTDALSTGGAYDIVQDLGGQIDEIRQQALILTNDNSDEHINDGEIIIKNEQTTYNKAINVLKGDTALKDTTVDGDLSVTNNVTVTGTVNTNNVVASGDITTANITASGDINGALKKSITVTDKDNTTHTYNNTDDVEITSVLSAQKDINGDSIDQTYIKNNKLGVANGVATLDNSGRLPYSQLPESAMELLGLWNAETNTPTITQGVGTNGDFYIVSVGGQQFGESFNVNDRIIFVAEDNLWHRLPYTVTSNVTSVNGQTGGVVLRGTDIAKTNNDSTNISDCLDNLQNITNATFKTALLNFCYPIGSLYWSSNSADPSTLFGGTWTQIKECFVWAKGDNDTVNATGGDKTVTLDVANLPSHNHSFTPSGTISVTTNPTFSGTAVTSGANNRGHTHSYSHTHKYAHTHGYTPSGNIASTSGGSDNKTSGMSANATGSFTTRVLTTDTQFFLSRSGNVSGISMSTAVSTYYDMVSISGSTTRAYAKIDFDVSHTHTAYFTGSAGTTTSQSANTTTDQSATVTDWENQNHTHSVTASGTISGGDYSFSGASGTTGTTGSGTALDIMPPYVVKYCFERIS